MLTQVDTQITYCTQLLIVAPDPQDHCHFVYIFSLINRASIATVLHPLAA